MPPEPLDTWLRRIGDKRALEERQLARLAGALNEPIRRRRSVAGKNPHPLACLCSGCVPAWQGEELRAIMNGEKRVTAPIGAVWTRP